MGRKKVAALLKLQIPAGQATPAPPVGPALGQHGVNIMDFVRAYNAATESQVGTIVPVEVTVYEDRSFTFVTKTPPAAVLLKKAASLAKGSAEPPPGFFVVFNPAAFLSRTDAGGVLVTKVKDRSL